MQIPEGLIVAKPMPKPGWQVELNEGDYAKSYDYFDTPVTKGVKRDRLDRPATCRTISTTSSCSARG